MRLKIKILTIFILIFSPIFLSAKCIKYAYVKSRRLNFREHPSLNSGVKAKLQKGTKVIIVDKKGKWFKILVPELDNETGWVYYSGLYKIKKVYIPDYKVTIKFNNFNETFRQKILEFKRFLNFDFYKKNVEIVFSYDKNLNKLTIFLKTEFSLEYYNQNKASSLKSNEIDLYPFLNFAYVIDNFIKRIHSKYPTCGEFLKKFSIDIILTEEKNKYIILDIYRKKKLYKFSPFIIVNFPDYSLLKIYCQNKEKLEKSYIFEIEPPFYSYGIKSTSFLLYEFFKMLKG